MRTLSATTGTRSVMNEHAIYVSHLVRRVECLMSTKQNPHRDILKVLAARPSLVRPVSLDLFED